MQKYKLLIDGELVDGERVMEVVNPATGRVVASCPVASRAQLDRAVSAAGRAQKEWAGTSLATRRAVIRSIAEAIAARAEQVALVLTAEQGKPLTHARFEIEGLCETIRNIANLDIPVEILEDSEVRRVEIRHVPLGVIAGILPWNFPVGLLGNKLPGALLAGNSLILKPAPTTPLSTLLIGEAIRDVTPPGLVNVLADDNDLGEAITTHPGIAKISFTGSTATGRKVMAAAALHLKRVTLELGGNDPAIVLGDVDVKAAAAAVCRWAFINSGQVCVAIKRVYVQDSIHDAFVAELAALADDMTVGDGMMPGVEMGPLQNRQQFEKAMHFLDVARKDGRIVAGGDRAGSGGFFIRPTVVRDIPDTSALVTEEQFAPILPVVRFADVEQALEHINQSPHGLGASVWSGNLDRAGEIAARIESGTVWVNQHMDMHWSIPLAPAKQSGVGIELGVEGLRHFSQVQVVNVRK